MLSPREKHFGGCGPEYRRDPLLERSAHTHREAPWSGDLIQVLPWPQLRSELPGRFGTHTQGNGHGKIRIRTQLPELFFMPRATFFLNSECLVLEESGPVPSEP